MEQPPSSALRRPVAALCLLLLLVRDIPTADALPAGLWPVSSVVLENGMVIHSPNAEYRIFSAVPWNQWSHPLFKWPFLQGYIQQGRPQTSPNIYSPMTKPSGGASDVKLQNYLPTFWSHLFHPAPVSKPSNTKLTTESTATINVEEDTLHNSLPTSTSKYEADWGTEKPNFAEHVQNPPKDAPLVNDIVDTDSSQNVHSRPLHIEIPIATESSDFLEDNVKINSSFGNLPDDTFSSSSSNASELHKPEAIQLSISSEISAQNNSQIFDTPNINNPESHVGIIGGIENNFALHSAVNDNLDSLSTFLKPIPNIMLPNSRPYNTPENIAESQSAGEDTTINSNAVVDGNENLDQYVLATVDSFINPENHDLPYSPESSYAKDTSKGNSPHDDNAAHYDNSGFANAEKTVTEAVFPALQEHSQEDSRIEDISLHTTEDPNILPSTTIITPLKGLNIAEELQSFNVLPQHIDSQDISPTLSSPSIKPDVFLQQVTDQAVISSGPAQNALVTNLISNLNNIINSQAPNQVEFSDFVDNRYQAPNSNINNIDNGVDSESDNAIYSTVSNTEVPSGQESGETYGYTTEIEYQDISNLSEVLSLPETNIENIINKTQTFSLHHTPEESNTVYPTLYSTQVPDYNSGTVESEPQHHILNDSISLENSYDSEEEEFGLGTIQPVALNHNIEDSNTLHYPTTDVKQPLDYEAWTYNPTPFEVSTEDSSILHSSFPHEETTTFSPGTEESQPVDYVWEDYPSPQDGQVADFGSGTEDSKPNFEESNILNNPTASSQQIGDSDVSTEEPEPDYYALEDTNTLPYPYPHVHPTEDYNPTTEEPQPSKGSLEDANTVYPTPNNGQIIDSNAEIDKLQSQYVNIPGYSYLDVKQDSNLPSSTIQPDVQEHTSVRGPTETGSLIHNDNSLYGNNFDDEHYSEDVNVSESPVHPESFDAYYEQYESENQHIEENNTDINDGNAESFVENPNIDYDQNVILQNPFYYEPTQNPSTGHPYLNDLSYDSTTETESLDYEGVTHNEVLGTTPDFQYLQETVNEYQPIKMGTEEIDVSLQGSDSLPSNYDTTDIPETTSDAYAYDENYNNEMENPSSSFPGDSYINNNGFVEPQEKQIFESVNDFDNINSPYLPFLSDMNVGFKNPTENIRRSDVLIEDEGSINRRRRSSYSMEGEDRKEETTTFPSFSYNETTEFNDNANEDEEKHIRVRRTLGLLFRMFKTKPALLGMYKGMFLKSGVLKPIVQLKLKYLQKKLFLTRVLAGLLGVQRQRTGLGVFKRSVDVPNNFPPERSNNERKARTFFDYDYGEDDYYDENSYDDTDRSLDTHAYDEENSESSKSPLVDLMSLLSSMSPSSDSG